MPRVTHYKVLDVPITEVWLFYNLSVCMSECSMNFNVAQSNKRQSPYQVCSYSPIYSFRSLNPWLCCMWSRFSVKVHGNCKAGVTGPSSLGKARLAATTTSL